MRIPISDRLKLCCSFVRNGERIADVGCDHGYLGLYLLQAGIASHVYASDVNEQPLLSAKKNAEHYGYADQVSFYLSDGLRNVPQDFDCAVMAGMGADTMISILDHAKWLQNRKYHLVLQCQSKRPMLRKYLAENGFRITDEKLAKDGKFVYPVMDVVWQPSPLPEPWDYYITPQVIGTDSMYLGEYMTRVIDGLEEQVQGAVRSGKTADQEIETILVHLRERKRSLML